MRPTAVSQAAWIPAGQDVVVGGTTLRGGLLYVGTAMPGSRIDTAKPALLDPRLPVDQRRPDWTGESMGYWPSYAEVSPQARAAYLAWLSGGRNSPNAYIGYVFLYFYGLEHRLIVEVPTLHDPAAEYTILVGEIRRLLTIYGGNGSFRRYAEKLLDAAAILDPAVRYDKPPPEASGWCQELPMELRIGLAQLVSTGRPIPADWALSWFEHHHETFLRTPATRCHDEFQELFTNRYRAKFGDGMILKPNKTRLSTSYYPASSSFHGNVTLKNSSLPAIDKLAGPISKLRELVDATTNDLDAYSRYLGRNPAGASSPAAIALLPKDLEHKPSSEAEALWRWAAEGIAEGGHGLASAQELITRWPTKTGKLAKADAVSVAQLLERRGFGIEPDVRFGGGTPAPTSSIVLFRRAEDQVTTPSPQYAAALAVINLGVLVAAADGTVSEPERRALRELAIDNLDLSEDEQIRLDAHAALALANPPTPAVLRRRLEALPESRKVWVGQLLTTIAAADGEVSTGEVRTLERLFTTLGLNPDTLYSTLHSVATAPTAEPGEDNLVRMRIPGQKGAGVKIPAKTHAGTVSPGTLTLDRELLSRKRAESARVSAELAEIFADRADEEQQTVVAAPPAGTSSVANLDAEHSELFRSLVERETWTRAEFDELIGSLGLLPDGAIEVLNEAAFDAADEPLCEGDDPIEINQAIVKDMLR